MEEAERTRSSLWTDYFPLKPWNKGTESPFRCVKCGESMGMLQWRPPFIAECVAQPKGITDISRIHAREWIVSDLVLDVLRKERFTGFELRGEVQIKRGSPKKVVAANTHKRFLIEAQPVEIRIDERASGIVRGQPVKCFYHSRSIAWFDQAVFLKPFNVKPPDIFVPYNFDADTCVTDRFKRVCESHGFTGVKFIHPLDLRPGFEFFPMGHELFVAHMDISEEEYLKRERAMIAKHGESIFDPKDDDE